MTSRFLDTNVLLYSISREPAETEKRDRALAILDERTKLYQFRCCRNFIYKQLVQLDAMPSRTRPPSN
jgi:predicted nucleic acid-binding protein